MPLHCYFQDNFFFWVSLGFIGYVSLRRKDIGHRLLSWVENYLFEIAFVVPCFYFIMLFILQENSAISVHDSFDSTFPFLVVLSKKLNFLQINPLTPIDAIMHGVPRGCLPSSLSFLMLWFVAFKPFHAYLLNLILIHIIAFVGMYLFLKWHFSIPRDQEYLIIGSSLCFAMLPFFPFFGLSIAGQPLLFYAFFNVLNRDIRWSDYFIIFLFPLYSTLYFAGVFLFVVLIFLFCMDFYRKRIANLKFLLLVTVFLLIYIIVDYQMLYLVFLHKTYVSHRSLYNAVPWGELSLCATFGSMASLFFHTHQHAQCFPNYIVRLAAPIAFLVAGKLDIKIALIKHLLYMMMLCAIFYGLNLWIPFIQWKRGIFLLNVFHWERFYFLFPVAWYVLFALFLNIITKIKVVGKTFVILIIFLQLYAVLSLNSDIKNNVHLFVNRCFRVEKKAENVTTFASYFPQHIFGVIGNYISLPKTSYKIITIGLDPAVPQYFGFYTLDGYSQNYPLSYKVQFRKIIERELVKNEQLRHYFDDWGNRCYLFSSELWEDPLADRILNLELNTGALSELGAKYIFSSVEIVNYKQNDLRFLKFFEEAGSFWRIYLYEAAP